MTSFIIDRRQNGHNKSIPNRNRFLTRVRSQIKQQVKDLITDGSIGSIFEEGKQIIIPSRNVSEPFPAYSREEGVTNIIVTGNGPYRVGDTIPKDSNGQGNGRGSGASDSGESEDDFVFTLSQSEFLKYFFEDLELPNLLNTDISVVDEFRTRKAGYSASGNPSNLSLLQTMKQSTGRRMALRAAKKRKLKELEQELELLLIDDPSNSRVATLEDEIALVRKKIKNVPFVDEIDLRYRNTVTEPIPNTHAVMFALMDVSGSMSDWHKSIAKRFYMLLYLFLHKKYDSIEIVFIRYTHEAREVDEETFFYGKESGGTLVAPGLRLVNDIINERYNPTKYNVYIAQASDGDLWNSEADEVVKLMQQVILPTVQHYFYVDISRYEYTTELMTLMKTLINPNFSAAQVTDETEIFTVFRKLFSKDSEASRV